MKAKRIVFAGGGTAGHVMPALAVAEKLRQTGHEISFVGARRGVEAELVKKNNFEIVLLPGRGIKRSFSPASIWWNLRAVLELIVAFGSNFTYFLRDRPAVAVIVGGYGASPTALTSVVLGIPMVVVQVDSHAGVVNKFAARFARVSALANESVQLPHGVVVGVPVRERILNVVRSPSSREKACASLEIQSSRKTVVVMSGSLGSKTINNAVSGLVDQWNSRDDLSIVHIGGLRNKTDLPKSDSQKLEYRYFDYLDNIDDLYAAANVIVSRAGANSVAEIGALGIPSVFIPLPNAPSDHQTKNAEPLVEIGLARILPDQDCNPSSLANVIEESLASAKPDQNALSLSKSAADEIAKLILSSEKK